MLRWIVLLAGLRPEEQVDVIVQNEPTLEDRVQRLVANIGRYKERDRAQLEEIISDLEAVLDTLDGLISALENIGGKDRALSLRKRLRNNQTRAQRALARLEA